jgi:hypothetical protein
MKAAGIRRGEKPLWAFEKYWVRNTKKAYNFFVSLA